MYGNTITDWNTEDGLILLRGWRREGYTLEDIAEKIGITQPCLIDWRKKDKKISDALLKGAEIVDFEVENALLKAALGYRTKEIKVTLGAVKKNGSVHELVKETTVKEIGPNPTACIMWLNNRKPDKWKRNRDKEENAENNNFTITIKRGADEKDGINNEVTVSSGAADLDDIDSDVWDSL